MNKLSLLAGALVLIGLLGFFTFWRAGNFSVPDEIRNIQCPQQSKDQTPKPDVFSLAGTTLAMPCWRHGTGRSMVNVWKNEEEKDPTHRYTDEIKSTGYSFMKTLEGRFDSPADTRLPTRSEPAFRYRYKVDATISLKKGESSRKEFFGRHREMSVPTPPAFSTTGPETIFLCQDATIHYQMAHRCVAQFQSKNLFWTIGVTFSPPVEDDFDMRPEVIEAYQLLAAHIIKQE